MKKKIIIFIILVVFSIIGFFIYNLKDGNFLKEEKRYIIVNENNKKIPAKIFYKIIKEKEITDKNNDNENVYEMLIFFDSKTQREYNPILIISKYKFIGEYTGGTKNFIQIKNKFFEKRYNNEINSLENNAWIDPPPIKDKYFSKDSIAFNSFGSLKKYGKYIIIKKH